MKNKSGERDDRKNTWLETADDEFGQGFYAGEDDEAERPERVDPENEEGLPEDAAAEFEDDDRNLEEPPKDKKKWILMGMAAICLVALATFLFSDRFYNMVRGKSSYTLEKTGQEVSFAEGNTSVVLDGNTLLRCSQDGLQALDESGEVIWDIPFTMSSPYMLKAGSYVSVADRLGTSVLLIRNGVVETEVTTEKKVLLHCVNEKGASAVVLDGGDSHSVNLYSSQGEILMQRHTYADADGIPVAIALSADSSRMATAYIHYTGTKVQSIITVFDLTENGSALVDRIVGSASYEDCLITDLRFVGDRCFYAGSDRIGVMEAGEACEVIWEKMLEYRIESLVMSDSYFAIRYGDGLAGTAAPVENNIVIYNYGGDVQFQQNLEDASYLDAWGDTVICGAGRSYYGISAKGSPKWQVDSIEDYSRLVAFESGDTVAGLRSGKIAYYKVTIKNATEEDGNE